MHSQEVSSRTTPTDSKYEGSQSYSVFHDADLAQLHQTATNIVTPEYYGPTLAFALPNWHALLGTRMLRYLARDQVGL